MRSSVSFSSGPTERKAHCPLSEILLACVRFHKSYASWSSDFFCWAKTSGDKLKRTDSRYVDRRIGNLSEAGQIFGRIVLVNISRYTAAGKSKSRHINVGFYFFDLLANTQKFDSTWYSAEYSFRFFTQSHPLKPHLCHPLKYGGFLQRVAVRLLVLRVFCLR